MNFNYRQESTSDSPCNGCHFFSGNNMGNINGA
jgi:hypothetical protein